MKPKRVLICGFTGNYGGMEAYIMNIYRNIDRTKLQFDFLYPYEDKMAFSDEVLKLGGHIYHVPSRKKSPAAHYRLLKKLFKEHQFAGMYYQCNQKLHTLEIFKYAKRYGVKHRVVHSHNSTQIESSKINAYREKLIEMNMDKYATDYFACSRDAGKWMFPGKGYTVINNGVDITRFRYDTGIRDSLRREMNIDDNTVVLGTVGRLSEQKYPEFMVEAFREYHKLNPDSVFIHIGAGEKEREMLELVAKYELGNEYFLVGKKDNVYDYMNVMDGFVLSSRYEGFPIVLVEAQSTGLGCIVSDVITEDVNITGKISYVPLGNPSEWAAAIDAVISRDKGRREDQTARIKELGYDIVSVSESIQKYFTEDEDIK